MTELNKIPACSKPLLDKVSFSVGTYSIVRRVYKVYKGNYDSHGIIKDVLLNVK